MTDTITYDKLETYEFDNLFELLDNRSNIPDPRNNPKPYEFVYDYDPLDSVKKNVDFNMFPHIFVGQAFEITESEKSVNGAIKKYIWKHNITVRSARYGAGNCKSSTQGRTDLNNIGSSLHKFFNTPSIRKSFGDVKMANIRFVKTSGSIDSYNTIEYYESMYELEFSVRLKVIA